MFVKNCKNLVKNHPNIRNHVKNSLSDPTPTIAPLKKILFWDLWDGMKPNPTPRHCSRFIVFLITHLDLQRSIFFFFPHSIPTYFLLFHSSLPSLFPLIISFSFFGNFSFFFLWFSFFLYFFLMFLFCVALFEVFVTSLFFSLFKKIKSCLFFEVFVVSLFFFSFVFVFCFFFCV